MADPWAELIAGIAESCRRVGFWSGEARLFRDADGSKRLGRRVAERIVARLADAGYEVDAAIDYESSPILVTPMGTMALASTVESLLPELRAQDQLTPAIPWRDGLIATRAVGRWLANQTSP